MDDNLARIIDGTIFSTPEPSGEFTGVLKDNMDALSRRRPVALVVSPPACDGASLCKAAALAIDGQEVCTVHAEGGREAQFYLPTFVYYYIGGVCQGTMVTHVHLQAKPGNRFFIEALHLKPVVLVRSIPDLLMALADAFAHDAKALADSIASFVSPDFPGYSHTEKTNFLVDMVAPWLVSFYASWFEYAEIQPERVLLLRYDDWRRSSSGALAAALRHCGLSQPATVCDAAIDRIRREGGQAPDFACAEDEKKNFFSSQQQETLSRLILRYPALAQHRDIFFQPSLRKESSAVGGACRA